MKSPLRALVISLFFSLSIFGQISADLVLLNGKIWTVNDKQPEAEAVAVLGHRIIAVGANNDLRKLIGPQTRVVDLQGRRVVPGFNDAHVHFFAKVRLKSASWRISRCCRLTS